MKEKRYLPNYHDGSIVNLMSSVLRSFGNKTLYAPLKILTPKELQSSKNIVLLVLDGLGYDYLLKHGTGGFLQRHLRGKMTSVFPSTTGAAIPSFLTGVAPQQHGSLGWFVFLKEIGQVAAILPFKPRLGGNQYYAQGIQQQDIISQKKIHQFIKAKYIEIVPQDHIQNHPQPKKIKKFGYTSLPKFISHIRKASTLHSKRKLIYAYWPFFDEYCHLYGTEHKKTVSQFKALSHAIAFLAKSLKKTNTTLLITADHGFIDTPKSSQIRLSDHPKLNACLTMPLCGDARVIYCYVRLSKRKQFESYVKNKMKKSCWMFKSEDLIKKNYFGLYKPNEKLFDRIGDYTLIMKKDYVLRDALIGQEEKFFKAHHSGMSREEMVVPLIVVNKK